MTVCAVSRLTKENCLKTLCNLIRMTFKVEAGQELDCGVSYVAFCDIVALFYEYNSSLLHYYFQFHKR